MPRWAFHLLGPPRLERDGCRVEIHRRKVLALLIYLAVTGRGHSRDSLAALFWPVKSQVSARAALRRTLSDLLKILEGKFILVEQDIIQLKIDLDFWLDIHEFHNRLNAYRLHGHHPNDPCPDCLTALGEAISLYPDEFMAGFTLSDSLGFDEWQILQAEILHRELVDALRRLTLGQAANGEIDAAINFAHHWLALDPMDEVAHRQLMQLYSWSGKRGEALRQYHECARILEHELGIAPQKETSTLYEYISKQDAIISPESIPSPEAVSPSPKPNNLPVQLTSFVGRTTEMILVGQEISRPEVHLLTLTGPGGVGKTRLSVEIAAQLMELFEHGVFFISLAALRDSNQVIPAIAHGLGVPDSKNTPLLESLIAYIRDRQMLLVLDNFEHLTPAAPLVTELLLAAPRLKVLVTSRTLLHVYGEHLHPVLPLKLPRPGIEDSIESLSQAEAVRLFVERAQAVKTDLDLSDQNYRYISEICTRLDGLPLAIELAAAARVRTLTPRSILDQWATEGGRSPLQTLIDGPRDRPDRHKTLRNAIGWSYNLLAADEQIIFRRAGVFMGGIALEAAENVIQIPQLDGANAIQPMGIPIASALESLADSHLLEQSDQTGEKHFSMLETIREYALEQMAACKEMDAVQEFHAQYYLGLAEAARQNLLGSAQASWVNRLGLEYENLRTALKWAITHQKAELALRLVAALGRFWYLYDPSYWSEGRSWLAQALNLSASETPPQNIQAKAFNEAGVLAWAQADHEQAIYYFEACLALKKRLGDKGGIGSALGNLGLVAREQLDLSKARKYQEESLAVKRELGDKQGIATTLSNLGLVVADMGEWISAVTLYEESIQLNRELQNKSGLALTLHNLGGLLVENLVDFPRAKAVLEESLGLSHELGKNFFLIPFTLFHLGNLALYQKEYERARELLDQSLTLSRELNSKFGMGHALHSFGYLYYIQGDYGKAQECFIQSLQKLKEIQGWVGIVWDFISMAGLACRCGNPARASTLLGASKSLREKKAHTLLAAKTEEYERNLAEARAQLNEVDFYCKFNEGLEMSIDRAITYAVG